MWMMKNLEIFILDTVKNLRKKIKNILKQMFINIFSAVSVNFIDIAKKTGITEVSRLSLVLGLAGQTPGQPFTN